MYNVDLNKIDIELKKLALDSSIFEENSAVDDKVLDCYKEVIMNKHENKNTNKKKSWIALVAVAVAAVLVVGALGIAGVFTPTDTTTSFIAMDINPSLVFEIDRSDDVKKLAFANTDAKKLLKGVDLVGTNAQSALITVAQLAKREGYLSEQEGKITLIHFSDQKGREKIFTDIEAKLEETLGFDIVLEIKTGSLEEGRAYVKFKEEQPVASNTKDDHEPTASPLVTPQPSPNPPPSIQPAPGPSLSPVVTSTIGPIMPAADSAGTGDVMFDIYDSIALADITNDGSEDNISFAAGGSSSTLTVNGVDYTISKSNLAQKFAITDVDISDGWLEIAFCDEYHLPDFDLDFPFTYYYWFDGTDFIECGSFWDMGWDGAWRADFNANDHMDGHGIIMSLDRSLNFTDAWYMAHWTLDGTNRQKKEDEYATVPLFHVEDLTLNYPCILLKNISLEYFKTSYDSMWDHASWPHSEGRVLDPGGTGDIVIIAQPGETLEVVKMYGKRWFKLRTHDGHMGWIRVVDFEMSGYDDVMYLDAWEIFDNIVVAG